jgi:hypothetical protein
MQKFFLNHQKTPKTSSFEYFVTNKKDSWYIFKGLNYEKYIFYLIKIREILIESWSILIWTAYQKYCKIALNVIFFREFSQVYLLNLHYL